jgi:hypothetical protein
VPDYNVADKGILLNYPKILMGDQKRLRIAGLWNKN